MACVMHLPTRNGLFTVPSEVGWEMNTLMPDDCEGFDDPLLAEDLYPPERFDHPNLRRLPEDFCPVQADANLKLLLAKTCAGLRHDLRVAPQAMRAAFESAEFPRREANSAHWMLPGLRADGFRTLACACGITLHDMVRGLWALYGSGRVLHAPWLNQWARNPNRPTPRMDYQGGSRYEYVTLWKRVSRTGGEIIRVGSDDEVPSALAEAERRGVEVVLVDECLSNPAPAPFLG